MTVAVPRPWSRRRREGVRLGSHHPPLSPDVVEGGVDSSRSACSLPVIDSELRRAQRPNDWGTRVKKKLIVVMALVAVSLGMSAPTSSAYVRNQAPVILEASCNPLTDTVYVYWDRNAGKPSYVQVTAEYDNGLRQGIFFGKIPGSRGSKGFWEFSPGSDLGVTTTYYVYLQGYYVTPEVTCYSPV